MLKITVMAETDETVTLKLEGRIIGQWVDEVREECEMWLAKGRKAVLDLSGIIFIDELGIETLKAMKRNGVNLIGCSLFLSGLLEENL
ncbi:STAS domain-containing protein [bacterium]|nr:STAS domain-containing protein [bacterium]